MTPMYLAASRFTAVRAKHDFGVDGSGCASRVGPASAHHCNERLKDRAHPRNGYARLAVLDWIARVALVGMEFAAIRRSSSGFKVDTSWPAPVLQQHAAAARREAV